MLIYLFLLSVILGGVDSVHAQKIKVVRDPESAKILTIKQAGGDLPSGDLAEKVERDSTGKSTLTLTADKRYEASVFCVRSESSEVTGCVHRVFVTDLQSDSEYEVVGEELFIESGRLIDNLKWLDSHTLSYERWTGPHFGHRYIVDVKQMKQTNAYTLSDQ
ncbi:MAG: hypothetical protein ABI878_14760 [Acidobacteriota bacterium]